MKQMQVFLIIFIMLTLSNCISEGVIVPNQSDIPVCEHTTLFFNETPNPTLSPSIHPLSTNCQLIQNPLLGNQQYSELSIVADNNTEDDISQESLYWTKVGAYGSWAGSIFGAIALVVSLCAFFQPRIVKVDAKITWGIIGSSAYGSPNGTVWTIEVKNKGLKPITIENIYLTIDKNDVFIGMVPQNTFVAMLEPKFPYRLEQGESFNYYVPCKDLNHALSQISKNDSPEFPVGIRVDEVLTGVKRFKTKLKLSDLMKTEYE